jgi:AAA15 family ATPase/GTPase
MKLSSVEIREYKSVQDSTPFEVGDVTCLVGKNEAGKTAILEALNRLNPLVAAKTFDVTQDYPRGNVEDYRQEVEQKKRNPAVVVSTVFKLTPEEMKGAKEEFGDDVFATDEVELGRGYENKLLVEIAVNEQSVVRHLVSGIGLAPEVAAKANDRKTLKDLADFLEQNAVEQQKAFALAQTKANAIGDAGDKAKALDESKLLAESEAAKQMRGRLATLTKQHLSMYIWDTYLEKSLPHFLYFDEYYQMVGEVNIQKLKERQAQKKLEDSDHPMLAFIDLARLNLDQLMAPQNTQELKNKLNGASVYLSKKIFKYWTQNKHLSINFDIRPALAGDPEGMREGTNLWSFVYDDAHNAEVRLGSRSRGFIWFFSFLAWFSQQQKTGRPLILLLDEPGLFLHASAQADLLNYIEKELKPHHQVIYTTHSPFMVDSKHFERVRIVRDKTMELPTGAGPLPPDEEGTKVLADVLEADEGSLFPLQGALAYDITQTLFVGPNSLIIEGVSDILYIDTMTGVLSRAGRTGLSDKWTLSPVGGADKVSTFVALMRGQKSLNIAVLIDTQKKDQQKIANLYKDKLLKKQQVLTFAEFTKTTEADIEDMFDIGFYLDLVNAEYRDQLNVPVAEAALPKHPRVVERLDQYFAVNPLKSGSFNHYRPARYFAENIANLAPKLSAATLARFEQAFTALNALLA